MLKVRSSIHCGHSPKPQVGFSCEKIEDFGYEPGPPVRGERRLEIRPSPFPSVATPQRAAMIGERVGVEASGRPDPISRNYGRYRARNRGAMVDTFDGALLRSRGNRFDRSGDCA